MSLIRSQVRVLRALALAPQTSDALRAACDAHFLTRDEVDDGLAALMAAGRIEIGDGARWYVRGCVGKSVPPGIVSAIEATCAAADACERILRGLAVAP